jgi:chromosome segregation ATPase
MQEWDAQLWIAVVGAIGGALTVIVGAWRAIARRRTEGRETRDGRALDALLSDADRMRDIVVQRLDTQQKRLDALQGQLDAARDASAELRSRSTMLETTLAEEQARRKSAEARATALARELADLRRDIGRASRRPPWPPKKR